MLAHIEVLQFDMIFKRSNKWREKLFQNIDKTLVCKYVVCVQQFKALLCFRVILIWIK